MSQSYQTANFEEERYCSSNNSRRPQHHNSAEFREKEEDYYYGSKVEAPACFEERGRPAKYCGDEVVEYEFTKTIREEDIVADDCVERKHHGRFNKLRAG